MHVHGGKHARGRAPATISRMRAPTYGSVRPLESDDIDPAAARLFMT